MIDINTESLVSMTEAAKDKSLGRPSVTTLWRWRTKGAGGRKLETVKIGGTVFTSREAIERFVQHGEDQKPAPPMRTTKQRQRAIEAAERELEEAGI